MLTVDSGPLTSEDKPLSCDRDSKKEQGTSFHHILKLNLFDSSFFFPNKISCSE